MTYLRVNNRVLPFYKFEYGGVQQFWHSWKKIEFFFVDLFFKKGGFFSGENFFPIIFFFFVKKIKKKKKQVSPPERKKPKTPWNFFYYPLLCFMCFVEMWRELCTPPASVANRRGGKEKKKNKNFNPYWFHRILTQFFEKAQNFYKILPHRKKKC